MEEEKEEKEEYKEAGKKSIFSHLFLLLYFLRSQSGYHRFLDNNDIAYETDAKILQLLI